MVVELDGARLDCAGIGVHARDRTGRDRRAEVGDGCGAARQDGVGERTECGIVDRCLRQRRVGAHQDVRDRDRLRDQRAEARDQDLAPGQPLPHEPEPSDRRDRMLRVMRRAIVGALLAMLCAAPTASAQPSFYDGSIPFACTLQQLGGGTAFPDPHADPFCVEYDKTHQNVTQLGVVDFLSKEPARVAIASDKCFYFQRDHWTGSVVQGQAPETYHWDGSYFFDKARGTGGAYVENFRLGGQPMDPTTLPGFPAEWKSYFQGGKGGLQAGDTVQADPSCATKNPPPGSGPPASGGSRCRVPGGRIGNGMSGLKLGATKKRAVADLGAPTRERVGQMVWCLDGGGRMVAALQGSRVRLLLTDASPFDTRGIRVGNSRRDSLKRMRREHRFARVGGSTVYMANERRRQLYVAVSHARVAWIAVGSKRVGRKGAVRMLRGAARA